MRHLLLSMLLLLACLTASAEELSYTYGGQTLTYTIDNETMTCEVKAGSYYYSGPGTPGNDVSGDLHIPSTINNGRYTYTVTSIGSAAFAYCSGLTSVDIPNSVTSIGLYAFYECSGLTSVDIPNSVTYINYRTFYGCSRLTSVDIPNSVTSIGNGAFHWCSGLTSVVIPESVTSIGESAFYYCMGLTSVEIPNSVTSIGSSAFGECSGLTSVDIGNSVMSIGSDAFRGCSGLTEVNIHDIAAWCNISFSYDPLSGKIYSNPLYFTHNLKLNGQLITDLVIPESVTSIGDYAFNGCSGLTSVVIPNSVTSIGFAAFSGCTVMKSVTIGSKVQALGSGAFSDCPLETIIALPLQAPKAYENTFDESIYESATLIYNLGEDVDASYADQNNVWWKFENYRQEYLLYLFDPSISISQETANIRINQTLQLRATVYGVDDPHPVLQWSSLYPDIATVDNNGIITGIAIGETDIRVTVEGHPELEAICQVKVLQPISISQTIANIYINQALRLNATVYGIDNPVLQWSSLNPDIATVDGNGRVTAVSAGDTDIRVTVEGHPELEAICHVVVRENPNVKWAYLFNGNNYTATITGCTVDGPAHVIIPETAYYSYTGHTYTVTNIRAGVFSGNTLIESIVIPKTVNRIAAGAFANCTSLHTVYYYPVSAEEFYDHWSSPVFSGCTALRDIIIGETVNSIPAYLFKKTPIEVINIPDSVESLLSDCFASCLNLKEIHIGTGVKNMEASCFALEDGESAPATKLYFNARRLASYTGLNGGTSYMPFNNRNLTEVIFGNEVRSLPTNAFRECDKLTDIYCNTATPPTLSTDCFLGTDKSACTLHVLPGTKSLYESAYIWQDFLNIVEDATGIDAVAAPALTDNEHVEIYNPSGRKVYSGPRGNASLENGLYIVRQGNTVKKIMISK